VSLKEPKPKTIEEVSCYGGAQVTALQGCDRTKTLTHHSGMQGRENLSSNFNELRFMRSLINAVPRYSTVALLVITDREDENQPLGRRWLRDSCAPAYTAKEEREE
jgi:hypothetical protein